MTGGELLAGTLPNIATARLPANYEAAVAALKELDRITRNLALRPAPTSAAEREAELLLWQIVLDGAPQIRRAANAIQARAIRNCGALMRERVG